MKITMTLGPASLDKIEQLLPLAHRFRLNTSFMSPGQVKEALSQIGEAGGMDFPVVLDLQGAKMRLGEIAPVEKLPEELFLVYGEKQEAPDRLPVPWKRLFLAAEKGDHLSLNDDRVRLEVTAREPETLRVRVLRQGPLSSRKGINRACHPIPFDELSSRDQKVILAANPFPGAEFALSFVHDGTETALIRPLTEKKICAKIERPESFDHLEKIRRDFDELWLCRGDLGAQGGLRQLGHYQELFEEAMAVSGFPGILAGQVVEHMTHFPRPTRSEVVQLYQAREKGYEGIILSDETAVGKYPLELGRFLSDFYADHRP